MDFLGSAHAHHITATARRGPESSNATHLHIGAALDAGKNNKVRLRGPGHVQGSSSTDRWNSFMAHPETLLPMTKIEDPVQRFVAVVKFYLSGWHIRPAYAHSALPHSP